MKSKRQLFSFVRYSLPGAGVGMGIFVLGVFADNLVEQYPLNESFGFGVCAIISIVTLYERARMLSFLARLDMIAEVNHHVRNCLQDHRVLYRAKS
jgi:hypothetical protein